VRSLAQYRERTRRCASVRPVIQKFGSQAPGAPSLSCTA
jgi:hypothetical protein